jgi:hypothetical protein
MNIQKNLAFASFTAFTLAFAEFAAAQSNQSKQVSPSYVENCAQHQVQVHQKMKEISADHFRAFCECTSKQLMNNLSASQLDELNKSDKRPAWLKPAEDIASKSCLKPAAKTQV